MFQSILSLCLFKQAALEILANRLNLVPVCQLKAALAHRFLYFFLTAKRLFILQPPPQPVNDGIPWFRKAFVESAGNYINITPLWVASQSF